MIVTLSDTPHHLSSATANGRATSMTRTWAADTPQRRPNLIGRALTTPPVSPTDAFPQTKTGENQWSSILTPPTSPLLMRTSSDFREILQPLANASDTPSRRWSSRGKDFDGSSEEGVRTDEVIECGFDVEVLKDEQDRAQIFGVGAWSTVYKAVGKAKYGMIAQASSPSLRRHSIPVLVALKTPSRKDAIPILKSEAIIMSELARTSGCDGNVVSFYGIIPATTSLVLAAIPRSLEDHIKSCALKELPSCSIWDTSSPVVGSTSIWLDLTMRSISALAWLHDEAGVIHSDIKPGNILLRPNWHGEDRFGYDPLFADFSSGQLCDRDIVTPNTLSAITREYAAPELLISTVLKNPSSAATTACDVFSLAVTLLVAATGELMVYSGSLWQRQAMALQGWNILNHVRNGEQGGRIPPHEIVDQVLERAVLKAGMGRITARAWKALVEKKISRRA